MRSLDMFESKLAEGELMPLGGGRMPAGIFWKRVGSGVLEFEDAGGINGTGGTLDSELPEATLC